METNHIELPNANDKVKLLERRLDMLEQIVAQLDQNLATTTIGSSVLIEALRKLLVEKSVITDEEFDKIAQELALQAREEFIKQMQEQAKQRIAQQ